MAEAMATGLVKAVFMKLADKAFEEYVRSQGIQSELKNLERELSEIQAVLIDASDKEIKEEAVKKWLNDLQHLAYDIDDILDDVATEAMHHKQNKESGAVTSKVRKFIPKFSTKFSLSHRLSPKLDSLTTELRRLEKRREVLGLIKRDEKPKSNSRRSETSLPDVYSTVGRKGEVSKLLKKLLQNVPCKENFSILPIVGMGGIGKTTLARVLYNNTQVKDHFELQAWICVSEDFDIFKISKIMFQVVSGKCPNHEDLNQIQLALKNKLKDKRFLLVLDDVWNENYDDWENLVRPFHSGAPGSKIIMTTRKELLLEKLGFDHLNRLESLSHEDALSLFALHAFGVDNFDSHETLKPQGEGIVKKCGGLPLALRTLGRMMKTKANEEDWDDVLNSKIWDQGDFDKIVPGLRLSYYDLSTELKQLFAYCSLFPKDFLFAKEELVLLWMAEGFLNQSNTTKSPERLGYEYFEILFSRSFFQHAPNNESFFIMHDLMNDLATLVAGEFFLRFDNRMKMRNEALEKYRYTSFVREEYVCYDNFESFKQARSLRTFLGVSVDRSWKYYYLSNKILVDLLPKLPLLRVLSLSSFCISEVPLCIASLKHLRYLNMSRTQIIELPENVGNLYNLQILILFGCESLTKLPKSFSKLKKLRHFDIRDTPLLKKMPMGIGALKSLHTLTKIIIGGDNSFSITELKRLKNLHGKISIEGLHNVQSAAHAHEVNISLKNITELELNWGDEFDVSRRDTFEKEVLNELKPNCERLKEISIECYGGSMFPDWIGDSSFHVLVHVSIRGCIKCISLPPFGQLPSLKELIIQGMNQVKVIGSEFIGSTTIAFPSLKVIRFEDMLGWEAWSTKDISLISVFPCLQKLQIENCPKLSKVLLDTLPSLKILHIDMCNDVVLRSLVQVASTITTLTIHSILGLTYEVWKGVMKYIGIAEEVSIKFCDEIKYLWESQEEASKVLVNLKILRIYDCSNLVSLGEKEEENFECNLISSLKILQVAFCGKMERLCCPNNIESLEIYQCTSVASFFFPTSTGGGQNLKSLHLYGCKKLMDRINNTNMPMLENVSIYCWTSLTSINDLSNFIHLNNLSIQDCESLKSFPDIQLSNLTLLKHLVIKKCPSIDAYFPRGHWPRKLISLKIGGLKKPISEWGPQYFPASLVELWLSDEDVTNFSHLSDLLPLSLTKLHIEEFDQLKSLSKGLQHLTSLQHLVIENCPKMKYLPETVLPSLLSLRIRKSQKLKERCKGRGSHYWPLISHVLLT